MVEAEQTPSLSLDSPIDVLYETTLGFEDSGIIQFVNFRLECLDCGADDNGYTPIGFDPELKFECAHCKSRNTERY
jgi:Zn finger protein HypA/HybF involved in hydrogenase expression